MWCCNLNRVSRWFVASVVLALCASSIACSSEEKATNVSASPGSSGSGGEAGDASAQAGFGGALHLDGGATDVVEAACVNLECAQVTCEGGASTRITGTVFAPNIDHPDPLPNVVVFVPNAPLQPFSQGVACEPCDHGASDILVATVSRADGTFELDDAPVGSDIPLVMQAGRWRRQITVPSVSACVDNPAPPASTQMPRKHTEGDIPKMALLTGDIDALECTVAKLLDVSEMTAPSGGGRLHLYQSTGASANPPLPPASDLWNDPAKIMQYDIILLGCGAHNIPESGAQNLKAFAGAGGRIFAIHHGGDWIKQYGWPGIANWNFQPDPASPLPSIIETGFPKGKTFADWLDLLNISSSHGHIDIPAPQWYVDSVVLPAQQWVYSTSPPTTQHFTYNVPLSAPEELQCGRVVFSLFHVNQPSSGSNVFPSHCQTSGPLTTNEKIIEYMLFDAASRPCPDTEPVTPPK